MHKEWFPPKCDHASSKSAKLRYEAKQLNPLESRFPPPTRATYRAMFLALADANRPDLMRIVLDKMRMSWFEYQDHEWQSCLLLSPFHYQASMAAFVRRALLDYNQPPAVTSIPQLNVIKSESFQEAAPRFEGEICTPDVPPGSPAEIAYLNIMQLWSEYVNLQSLQSHYQSHGLCVVPHNANHPDGSRRDLMTHAFAEDLLAIFALIGHTQMLKVVMAELTKETDHPPITARSYALAFVTEAMYSATPNDQLSAEAHQYKQDMFEAIRKEVLSPPSLEQSPPSTLSPSSPSPSSPAEGEVEFLIFEKFQDFCEKIIFPYLALGGKWSPCLQLIADTEQRYIELTTVFHRSDAIVRPSLYHTAIRLCDDAGRYEEIFELYSSAIVTGVPPDLDSFVFLLRAAFRARNWMIAKEAIEQIETTDQHIIPQLKYSHWQFIMSPYSTYDASRPFSFELKPRKYPPSRAELLARLDKYLNNSQELTGQQRKTVWKYATIAQIFPNKSNKYQTQADEKEEKAAKVDQQQPQLQSQPPLHESQSSNPSSAPSSQSTATTDLIDWPSVFDEASLLISRWSQQSITPSSPYGHKIDQLYDRPYAQSTYESTPFPFSAYPTETEADSPPAPTSPLSILVQSVLPRPSASIFESLKEHIYQLARQQAEYMTINESEEKQQQQQQQPK